MSVSVVCPHCGSRLKSGAEPPAGKGIKCPKCGKVFRYEPGAAVPPAPPDVAAGKGSGGLVLALLAVVLLLGGGAGAAWWLGLLPGRGRAGAEGGQAAAGGGGAGAGDQNPAAAGGNGGGVAGGGAGAAAGDGPQDAGAGQAAAGPRDFEGSGAPVKDLVYSRDGKRLAATDAAGAVRAWDLATGKGTTLVEGVSDQYARVPQVDGLAFSPDGGTLFVGGAPPTAYDVATGKPRRTYGPAEGAVEAKEGPPNPLILSPGGSTTVTAEYPGDGTTKYRVRDTATGEDRLSFDPGQFVGTPGTCFDPSGELFAFAPSAISGGGKVRLFDVKQGKERSPVQQGYQAVMLLAGGRMLGWKSKGDGGTCDEWELGDGSRPARLVAQTPVRAAAFPQSLDPPVLSPDGKTLLYGATGAVLWDIAGRKPRAVVQGNWQENALFTPDGRSVLTLTPGASKRRADGSDETPVVVVEADAASGSVRATHEVGVPKAPEAGARFFSTQGVGVLAVAPDGAGYAVGMTDGSVRLRPFRAASGEAAKLLATVPLTEPPVGTWLRFSPDGKYLIVSGRWGGLLSLGGTPPGGSREVVVYEASSGKPALTFDLAAKRAPGGDPPVEWNGAYRGTRGVGEFERPWEDYSVTVALPHSITMPRGRDVALFTNSAGHRFSLDLASGAWRLFPIEYGPVPKEWNPEGFDKSSFAQYANLVASPAGDGVAAIVKTWAAVPPYKDQNRSPVKEPDPVNTAPGAFKNGARLVFLAPDSLKPMRVLLDPVPNDFAFSPDGKLVACVIGGGEVKLVEVATGAERPTTARARSQRVGFTSGGAALVTDDVRGADYYDLESGQLSRTLDLERGHPAGATAAAFPWGTGPFATGGGDGQVLLRDPQTGDARSRFDAHPGGVAALAFSPDGKVLASAGEDKTVKLWDVSGASKVAAAEPTGATVSTTTLRPPAAKTEASQESNRPSQQKPSQQPLPKRDANQGNTARPTGGNRTLAATAGTPKAAGTGPKTSTTGPKVETNSIGMMLVVLPAGSFTMGARDGDPNAEPNERPAHTVRFSKPFALGAHEVTVGQFRRFVEATGYQTEAEADGSGGFGYDAAARVYSEDREPRYSWREVGWAQTDAHPVVNVSWNDAKAFCVWLSGKEGKRYRLPTEAEWEYACRAGTKTRFWTGDEDSSVRGAENMADVSLRTSWDSATWVQAWDDGQAFTAPAGHYRANPWGLFDMHGNVIEWIADWHDDGYYAASPDSDPQGPSTGTERLWRGGSWYFEPRHARASARTGWSDPTFRDGATGFRVAREL